MTLAAKILQIASKFTSEPVQLETNLHSSELGDQLTFVEILDGVEQYLDVEISDHDRESIKTAADLIALVSLHVGELVG